MKIKELLELSEKSLASELIEDLGGRSFKNDITTSQLLKKSKSIKCIISNREEMILSGLIFIVNFLKKFFPKIEIKSYYKDGDRVKKNSTILIMSGNAGKILTIERTLLNFLQHLSSISSITNRFVSKMGKSKTQLLDTRKTTTGLRKFEKYATSIGGAKNHRMGLYDDFLVKDNHIKILGGIDNALAKVKEEKIKKYKIECESFEEVKRSIKMGAKYILLDNMNINEIKKCIKLKKKNIIFEITGGITLKNISAYSKLGADFISTSKITNSSYSLDIGLDII